MVVAIIKSSSQAQQSPVLSGLSADDNVIVREDVSLFPNSFIHQMGGREPATGHVIVDAEGAMYLVCPVGGTTPLKALNLTSGRLSDLYDEVRPVWTFKSWLIARSEKDEIPLVSFPD